MSRDTDVSDKAIAMQIAVAEKLFDLPEHPPAERVLDHLSDALDNLAQMIRERDELQVLVDGLFNMTPPGRLPFDGWHTELRAERDALRAEVERLRLDVGRLLVAYGSRDEFDGVDDAIEDAAEMRAENNRLRAFVAALRSDGLDIDDPDTAPHWTGKIHAPDGRLVFDLATVGEPSGSALLDKLREVTAGLHASTGIPYSALCHYQDRPHCAGCPDDATCEASGREPRGTP